MRTLARVSNALALAVVLALGVVLVAAPPRYLIPSLFGDDAGYYLAIARNALLGHGVSFDRLHPTNGFNPLMSLLLIVLDRALVPDLDLERCLRLAGLVSWAAIAWSLVSLRRLCSRAFARFGLPTDAAAAGAVATWFAAGFVALKTYYGMDAFLVWALGLAYFARVAHAGVLGPGPRAALADGALLGASFLARVDSLPLVVAAFAGMLPHAIRDPRAMRRALGRLGTAVALIAPYIAWNRLRFGDWLPISARLKSSFPHWDPGVSLHAVLTSSLNPPDEVALVLGLVAAAAWWVVRIARRMRLGPPPGQDAVRSAIDVWALYLLGRLVWLLLFSRMDVQGSYFILVHAFLALGLLMGAWRLAGARGLRAATVALAVVTLALAGLRAGNVARALRDVAAGRDDGWIIGHHVRDATRDGDVIYGGAFGIIGYASDRPWINADGVANDRGYQDAIRDHVLARRLERDGTTHVALALRRGTPVPAGPLPLPIYSELHGVSDTLWLDPVDLVLREPMRRGGGTEFWLLRAHGGLGRGPRGER